MEAPALLPIWFCRHAVVPSRLTPVECGWFSRSKGRASFDCYMVTQSLIWLGSGDLGRKINWAENRLEPRRVREPSSCPLLASCDVSVRLSVWLAESRVPWRAEKTSVKYCRA